MLIKTSVGTPRTPGNLTGARTGRGAALLCVVMDEAMGSPAITTTGGVAPRVNSRRRRRRGRPPLRLPSRLPARPHWDQPEHVQLYLKEWAVAIGGWRLVEKLHDARPQDALALMVFRLIRRHDDQVRRALRAPPREAAERVWRASRLLGSAARLAMDAAAVGPA